MRFCPKCKTETDRDRLDRCKPCTSTYQAVWRAANSEKIKEYRVAYHAANTEKMKASSAAWKAANPEKVKTYGVARYAANPEKYKALWAAYYAAHAARYAARYAANPEKYRAQQKSYCKANPDAKRIRKHNRRARELESGGILSKGLSDKLFKLQRGKCPCCGQPLGSGFHLDHIMPTALGGSNTDDNIQLLRQQCNNQKHAKHPVDFMQSKGFLI
jgi:5-methylcytosine-specific restriction endonuclease McrA